MSEFDKKLDTILQDIQNISPQSGLLLSTKGQSPSVLKDCLKKNSFPFGENYYQEAILKIKALESFPVQWHFIGQIQKNKINKLVGTFSLIQSLSSMEHLSKVNSVAQEKKIKQPLLLQINIANEKTKAGFLKKDLLANLESISKFSSIEVKGLMSFPPYDVSEEEKRKLFKESYLLWKTIKEEKRFPHFDTLSMGTSKDYKIALEEGSTLIRIGRELFS